MEPLVAKQITHQTKFTVHRVSYLPGVPPVCGFFIGGMD